MAVRRYDNPTIPIAEACKRLGMGRQFMSDLMRNGLLREIGFAVKRGNRWRYIIYKDRFEKFVSENEKRKE